MGVLERPGRRILLPAVVNAIVPATVGTLEDLPLPLALLDCEALSIVAQNSDEARRRVWGRDPGFHAE